MRELATYLINLDRATERCQVADNQICNANLTYERISAIDGSALNVGQKHHYDETLAFNTLGRSLSVGEIGCYLSHVRAAELFLKKDLEYCLVLEDDFELDPDFTTTLSELIMFLDKEGSADFDVVNLCNEPKRNYNKIHTIVTKNSSFDLCRAHFFPVLTTAILWTRSGAEKFLAACYPIHSPIDQFLKDWCIQHNNGLCFLKPPVTSSGAESQIDFSSHHRNAKRGRRVTNYFIRKQIRSFRNKKTARASYVSFRKSLK